MSKPRLVWSVLDGGLVRVAIEPALSGLGRGDDGMPVACACLVAWRFGELSQQ